MSEQEPFVKVQVTFELNLYHGRLGKPFSKGENWLLYYKDQFTNSWMTHDELRTGEYIYVLDAKQISPNQ